MSVGLNRIIEELQHLHPCIVYAKNLNNTIRTVKHWTENTAFTEPEVLYVCPISLFPVKIPVCNVLNLLVLGDSDQPVTDDQYGDTEGARLNLIRISNRTDIGTLFNTIQDVLLRTQSANDASTTLLDLLIHNSGFQHIIDAGYQMLGNPLFLMDLSSKLLGITNQYHIDNDLIWQEITTNGYLSYHTIQLSKEIGRTVDNSQVPVIIQDSFMTYTRIIGKVEIGGTQAGVVCVLEYEKPFLPQDIENVALLCKAISLEMQKNKYSHYTREVMYETFIQDLLEGKIRDRQTIIEKTKILGLSFSPNLYILTIDVNEFDSNGSLLCMKDMVSNILSNTRSIIYKGHVVTIFSCCDPSYFNGTILKHLKEFLRSNNMFCGISSCYHHLEESQEYYNESLKALKLGQRLNKEDLLYIYGNYAIYDIAEQCCCSDNLIKYCHPALLTLISLDKQKHTCYAQSLYVYIFNLTNIAESASALHIHRNTMIYRIKKIEEITHLHLSDSDVLLHLHLSFKFLEYLDRLS